MPRNIEAVYENGVLKPLAPLDLKDGLTIFIDANIFIYHFWKESMFNPASSDFLDRVERRKVHGITSTAVAVFTKIGK